MENDINNILATKRDWRTAERRKADRRIKDGSPEDRKIMADVLREGKKQEKHLKFCTCSICELNEHHRPWWFRLLRKIGFLAVIILILSPNAQAQEVDLSRISMIESTDEPLAYNNGHVGMFQISQGVVTEWNNSLEIDTIGHWSQHYDLNDMYDPDKAKEVAGWFLNTKIPYWLTAYGIPDTTTSRIIAWNWGIGHLHHWFKQGSHWNRLPIETRKYIIKYQKEKQNDSI